MDPSVVGMRGAARVLMKEGAGLAFYRGIGVAMIGEPVLVSVAESPQRFCRHCWICRDPTSRRGHWVCLCHGISSCLAQSSVHPLTDGPVIGSVMHS